MPSSGWDAVIGWWDGVELWLAQQWLPLQVTLLMLVLLPVCWWAARLTDRAVGIVSQWLRRLAGVRDAEGPP